MMPSEQSNISRKRVIKALALASANYYKAEGALRDNPGEETLLAFFAASERFVHLRNQLFQGIYLGDAIRGSEEATGDVAYRRK